MATSQIYSEGLSEQILDLVRIGLTLRLACEKLDLPIRTVRSWKGRNVDHFADRYHHARQDQAEMLADQILEIADDCPCRDIDLKRAALQIQTRKWLIEKLHPRIFDAVARVDQDKEVLPVESPLDFLTTWKAKHNTEMAS
jgi:hypothetical protein